MSELFDKKFADKFRTSFENYEEPFNNEAWDLMKQKLSEKNKKRIIPFINIAKAASVILIFGAGIFYFSDLNRQQSQLNPSMNLKNKTKKNNSYIIKKHENGTIAADNKIHNNKIFKKKHFSEQIINNKKTKSYINKNKVDKYIADENNKPSDSVATEIQKKLYADLLLENNEKITNSVKTDNKVDSVNKNKPVLLPEDDFLLKTKKSRKKFNFGIAVSSYYSASDMGVNDIINAGGGLSAEYVFTDKLCLTSGLSISNHNFNTENTGIFGGLKSDGLSENSTVYAGSSETDIKLLAMDIPLNLKVNFNKIYISGGISSLFYLKESFSEKYYVENTNTGYNSQTGNNLYTYNEVTEFDNKGAFKTFDFAKLVNIAIGYKIPMKKGQLIFEPYAKIPTGKLTSYKISFGYGGLTLKYEF